MDGRDNVFKLLTLECKLRFFFSNHLDLFVSYRTEKAMRWRCLTGKSEKKANKLRELRAGVAIRSSYGI